MSDELTAPDLSSTPLDELRRRAASNRLQYDFLNVQPRAGRYAGHTRRQDSRVPYREIVEAEEAEDLQQNIRADGERAMIIFARNGFRLWKFKARRYHRHVGHSSFDAWVSDPEQQINPSTAHLSVQMVDLLWAEFGITADYIQRYNDAHHARLPMDLLERIGEGKYQVILPEIETLAMRYYMAHRRLLHSRGKRGLDGVVYGDKYILRWADHLWQQYRIAVMEWLAKAWALPRSELKIEAKERAGWETLISTPISIAHLESCTKDELLGLLIPPSRPEKIQLTVRWKPEKLAAAKKAGEAEDARRRAESGAAEGTFRSLPPAPGETQEQPALPVTWHTETAAPMMLGGQLPIMRVYVPGEGGDDGDGE